MPPPLWVWNVEFQSCGLIGCPREVCSSVSAVVRCTGKCCSKKSFLTSLKMDKSDCLMVFIVSFGLLYQGANGIQMEKLAGRKICADKYCSCELIWQIYEWIDIQTETLKNKGAGIGSLERKRDTYCYLKNLLMAGSVKQLLKLLCPFKDCLGNHKWLFSWKDPFRHLHF